MKRWLAFLPVLLILLTSCNGDGQAVTKQVVQKENQAEVSNTFTSGSYKMIGEEERIGFIYSDASAFKAGEPNKYMWHLWGDEDELDGSLKVIGRHQETNEEIVVFESDELAGPHNGADAHVPSTMQLPSTGVWELDAYVGEEFFGTIVVEVM
ncbi:DUF4871 domain-containing protein [Pseudalkalibacillus sp. JSM 102089]|uniref:DUF4871 domain-containing protein n=1 Tax=Pseudalkalibacillus sp. JSM 102089 TaxID=3229856 RepID=UPI003525C854